MVGTLTSKTTEIPVFFIVSSHMDRGNLFTLIGNIKVMLHQKDFLFEVTDTKLLTEVCVNLGACNKTL